MHPPADPPRTLFFRLEHEALMREAASFRLAERVQTQGCLAGLRHVAMSRLRALRSPLVARHSSSGARRGHPLKA